MRWVAATICLALASGGCCRSEPAGDDGGEMPADIGFEPDAATEGGPACTTDADCAFGAEWCVGGRCVPCDNSGLTCTIPCETGTTFYVRNGCHPCDCAPSNQCRSDADCGPGLACYAGAFCWDGCPPGDPTCCFGNICSGAGCSSPPPTGCKVRGCPSG